MSFIQATAGLRHSVIYQEESGKYYRYSGGTWTWRNNNPGNLVTGNVSKRHNQIGIAGGFAVFPDEETGRLALLDCLKNTYGNSSIDKLVESYAPEEENDVVRYRNFLHKKTGVEDDKKINDFTEEEFTKLWKAIIQFEGHKVGKIKEVHKVTRVKKNKRRLCELHLNDLGWTKMEDCVYLAKTEALELIVCNTKSGREYLRSLTHDLFQAKLSSLIVVEA